MCLSFWFRPTEIRRKKLKTAGDVVPALFGFRRARWNLGGVPSPAVLRDWPRRYVDGIPVFGVFRALLFRGMAFRGYNFWCRDAVAGNRAGRRNEMETNSI